MAYDDWGDGFQETFDSVPGIHQLRDYEYSVLEDLYERGFTRHADTPGYSADDVHAARQEFFDFYGLPEELFPWDDWREAMGYDD